MNFFLRPLVAALAAAFALPAASLAQNVASAASPFSTSSPAAVERAALDRTASSSSSSSSLFERSGQSSISTQAAPMVKKPQESSRPLSSVGIGVKVGAAGVGFDIATPLMPGWMNLRGGASFFSYDAKFSSDNIDIDGSLKFQNAQTVIDVFPFHGGFRLSGGLTVRNDTGIAANLSVPPGQSFKLGSATYYSSTTDPIHGTGSLSFGSPTAWRASIGTGNMLPRKGRFAFETEFGVQFFPSPTIVYNIHGSACATPNNPLTCGTVTQADVTAEQNKLQNDLNDLKYYPILSVGFSYKIH